MSQLPTIEISGADARDRGRQYGEAARVLIERSLAFYAESVPRATGLTWTEVLERAPHWVPVIEPHAPELLDEVPVPVSGSD